MTIVKGGKSKVSVEKDITCPSCNGTRSEKGYTPSQCSECGGRGFKLSNLGVKQVCPKCNGAGGFVRQPCGHCTGKGTIKSTVEE